MSPPVLSLGPLRRVRGGGGELGSGDVEVNEAIVMCAPDEQALVRIRAVLAAVDEEAAEHQPVQEAGCSATAAPAVPSPACCEPCAGDAKATAVARSKAEFAELVKAEFERLMVSGDGLTANQAAAQALKTTLATAGREVGDASGE